jgi:hypothetical protein
VIPTVNESVADGSNQPAMVAITSNFAMCDTPSALRFLDLDHTGNNDG